MRNIMRKTIVVIAVAMVVALCASFTAVAQNTNTISRSIELRTRSCLLVDRSGSIKDIHEVNNLMNTLELDGYDFIGFFDDQQISVDPNYAGGGDSFICETIDQMAVRGFTHISVITDGEQWPEDYSSLAAYTDLDVTIYLVGDKSEQAEKLVNELSDRMVNSSLTVKNPDGTEWDNLPSEYEDPVYSFDIPMPEIPESTEENSTTVINSEDCHCKHKCLWWVALIVALLGAALFDFIHELITRGRREKEDDEEKTVSDDVVDVVVNSNGQVVADYSGSMASWVRSIARIVKEKSKKTFLCFGSKVFECRAEKAARLHPDGLTYGWEALEEAQKKGWDEIILVSDLGFNGKAFQECSFIRKFKKITVVIPSTYDRYVLDELDSIAEEVEIIPLQ